MSADNQYWCELAVVAGAVASGVSIEIRDGRIAGIGTDTEPRDHDHRLPGLTVAGFANAHSHAFQRALRPRAQFDRGSFWTWREVMYQAALALDPDTYYRLARATFAEMVVAGTSAVGEFHYVHHQADGTPYDNANAMGEALLAAAKDVGLRITLLDTLYLQGGLDSSGYLTCEGTQLRYADASTEAWMGRLEALTPGPGQKIGAAVHSVRAARPDDIRKASAWARSQDLRFHVHASEQLREIEQCLETHGCSPIVLLERAEALSPRTTVVHATHLEEADVTAISKNGSAVCMCSTTERDLGDGLAATSDLTRANVPICTGSDSHAVIDPLIEARAVELGERLRTKARGLHSAPELLEMATVNGHRQLGWEDAGTLRVGHRADLTTIAMNSIRTAGSTTKLAIETAIFSATASDVLSVVIDGVQWSLNGEHLGLDVAIELEQAIQEVMK